MIDQAKNYIRVEGDYAKNYNEGPLSAAVRLHAQWDKLSLLQRYIYVSLAFDAENCPGTNGYGTRHTLEIMGETSIASTKYTVQGNVIDLTKAQLEQNGMVLHLWEAKGYVCEADYLEYDIDFEYDEEFMRIESTYFRGGRHVEILDVLTFEYCGDDKWDAMSEGERRDWMRGCVEGKLDMRGDLMVTDGLKGSVEYEFVCTLGPDELRELGYVTKKDWNLCGETDEEYADQLRAAREDEDAKFIAQFPAQAEVPA
ncbi:hypothetical protein QTI05_24265 [Variovorax sp. J22R193]|uniref:hypothetical protein n=1 Tax=Variovorax fucosicus TaxID=3053517 RepID=UPI00257895A2|nr:hypothetical protein [Variovorax sp. J22R193]MDM0042175.1 hypothetical protein [Variovorax sp. J22R193]